MSQQLFEMVAARCASKTQPNLDAIRTYLDAHKQIVNEKEAQGQTALHKAAACDDVDLAKLLIEKHASHEVRDNNNKRAADVAYANNSEAVLAYFLSEKLIPNKNMYKLLEARNFKGLPKNNRLNAPPPLEPKGFMGPLCDTAGFQQKLDTCVYDAFLQTFLFADGIREIIQPALYNAADGEIEHYADTRADFTSESDFETFLQFVQYARNRFILHYDTLKCLYGLGLCQTPMNVHRNLNIAWNSPNTSNATRKQLKLKRHGSVYYGTLGARRFKNESAFCPLSFGIHEDVVERRARQFIQTFALPVTLKRVADEHTVGAIMFNDVYRSGEKMQSGHATATFKCGGRWMYFDNEAGILPIDERLGTQIHKYARVRDMFGLVDASGAIVSAEKEDVETTDPGIIAQFAKTEPHVLYPQFAFYLSVQPPAGGRRRRQRRTRKRVKLYRKK
jgi:hypothetical protein